MAYDFMNMATLTVRTDADCSILCDGERLCSLLEAGKMAKFEMSIGQHLLEFINATNPSKKVEKVVDFPQPGRNYLVMVNDLSTLFVADEIAEERSYRKLPSMRLDRSRCMGLADTFAYYRPTGSKLFVKKIRFNRNTISMGLTHRIIIKTINCSEDPMEFHGEILVSDNGEIVINDMEFEELKFEYPGDKIVFDFSEMRTRVYIWGYEIDFKADSVEYIPG